MRPILAYPILLVALHTGGVGGQSTRQLATSCETEPGLLNVHIVPHSHDDVGWLKTLDQYYWGANNSITTEGGVKYILDSAVLALQKDPARRFIYSEQAYFSRWWAQQTADVQTVVRQLVASGQLQMINGGWVMHGW